MSDPTTHQADSDSLRDLQGMAVMGELAEAVAHDFNNIISATLIHLGLLQQDADLNTGQREALRTLELEMDRAAGLTRQLLSFSRRRSTSKVEAIDLNELLHPIEKLLVHLVRENITLSIQPAEQACRVRGDIGSIEKLVMSLCLVFRDKMPRGGELVLRTSAELVRRPGEVGERSYVCLALSALGAGPPSSAIEEDLGNDSWKLEAARQIVSRHGGWIATSEAGEDLEIRVHFPEAGVVEVEKRGQESESLGGNETILLVEDEDFLRRVSTLSLRKLGYAVLDAADGDSAQKLWEKHQSHIDLLLADLMLPGAESGRDLASHFSAQKPSLRVMLASGNHADLDDATRVPGPSFYPAVKPYTASRLAAMVRECLDAQP